MAAKDYKKMPPTAYSLQLEPELNPYWKHRVPEMMPVSSRWIPPDKMKMGKTMDLPKRFYRKRRK